MPAAQPGKQVAPDAGAHTLRERPGRRPGRVRENFDRRRNLAQREDQGRGGRSGGHGDFGASIPEVSTVPRSGLVLLPDSSGVRERVTAALHGSDVAFWSADRLAEASYVLVDLTAPGGEEALRSLDHPLRLSRVRFLTLPCSRKLSRRRMAGGDKRFGTTAMYMPTDCSVHRD